MNIYPAIDLKEGSCVRLYKGSFEQVTTYNEKPLSVAQDFQSQGAKLLHVVDLDGAKTGTLAHSNIIAEIVDKTDLQLQVGGGIRHEQQVAELIEQGISRVIIGSAAIHQINTVKSWFKRYGADRIVLALDVRINENGLPLVAAHGWQEDTAVNLWDLLDEYQEVQLKHVLCTDINCDGTLLGPNIGLYQQYSDRYPEIQLQASGGIGCLEDLQNLAKIPVASVIVGKALYENKFSLAEALQIK